MEWYLKAFKNYAVFKGRARRKEYWMFVLFNLIVAFVIGLIETLIGISSILSTLYSLAVLLPGLSITVRRLHDTGRSGWWILIGLIPIVGSIILLVFMCLDSDVNTNEHGANPKFSA